MLQSGKSTGKIIVLCASICQFWKTDMGGGLKLLTFEKYFSLLTL